jgi:hypothetical protein
MKDAASGVMYLVLIALFGVFLYGSYFVVKTVSYRWWYEPMVKATVKQMVSESALRK